jgi:hypothetical protein
MIANGRTEYESLMPLCRRRWRPRTDDKRPRLNTKRDEEGLRKICKHTQTEEKGEERKKRVLQQKQYYYRKIEK